MAQAGLHGLVGMATRRISGKKDWVLLGLLLGNLLPDMDILAVAVATLAKWPTAGLHRTATHSLLFVALVVLCFYLFSLLKKDTRWRDFGIGLGAGILLHILLDLLLWFNGVALFWPLPIFVNLWANFTPPAAFMRLMDKVEFLGFAIYLWALFNWARKYRTDASSRASLPFWIVFELVLFGIFAAVIDDKFRLYQSLIGASYLVSLFAAFFITLRMHQTIQAAGLDR